MKKTSTDNQPTFDFDEPVDLPVTQVDQPVAQVDLPSVVTPSARRMTDLETYVEQIARDVATLRMDDCHPSREFYEERIASFREAVREL